MRRYRQAFLQVYLIGPAGKRSTPIAALFDTGAAFSIFDIGLASALGYATSQLPTVSIRLATGALVALPTILNAPLEIEGHSVSARQILLAPYGTAPLLAPRDMLRASDFGFDAKAVHFD